ncbi:MAG: site-specific integrase [Desulfobacteraceae bacterium]|nr:site-specific integrase [Desulfobacteraceae bacterium]
MTAARAAQIRARRIAGDELSNTGKRAVIRAEKAAEAGKWTIDRLFDAYMESRAENEARGIDKLRYNKHLKTAFGSKEPCELIPLDIDRMRIHLLKKLSPQSVKHVLNLLTWIVNYGVKKNLCAGIAFHISKPPVNNLRTEDLTDSQLKALLKAIDEDSNIQIQNLMRLALCTGMRRGELFKLKWEHIDFDRGFINIVDPKGGIDQKIPLNAVAREILEKHERPKFKVPGNEERFVESPYVFPGNNGKHRVSAQAGTNRIKKAAGLPKDFRPLHGLRHAYASMLASSGQVDLYQLQRLLTHKDSRMTMRYAHLRDQALRRASDVAADILGSARPTEGEKKESNVA